MIEFELKESVLRADVPLAGHSTMRVGGNARYFFEIGEAAELPYILRRCRDFEIPVSLLGAGSNTLVSDYGTEGAVLWFGPRWAGVERLGEDRLYVRAGASVPGLCRRAAELGLSGLEFACGIPASAGGATAMNCGAFGGAWAERVVYVDAVCGCDAGSACLGDAVRLTAAECGFGYRDSRILREGLAVTGVCLRLVPSAPERVLAAMHEVSEKRRRTQGVTLPSLGSVFRREEGLPPPAKLIDDCGLKGFAIGGAAVSERHAGYIVNRGGATCENILALIAHIKSTVWEKCGIILHEEIRRMS